jgi:acetolactate synthase-1/2/3 large subunit
MSKSTNRGRPTENDTPILQYTQNFKAYTGETFTWEWDKTRFPNGPLSVTIKDPQWSEFDRLENKLSSLLSQYEVKGNESIIYSGGHGAMGFSFPAAIGAHYTNKNRPIISFNGDGGFQMNLQELQFVVREKIPLKIIIVNNKSLGMIRHFQEIYFDSRFTLTSENMGYSNPNFLKIANAYGIDSISVSSINEIKNLSSYLKSPKPVLIELMVGETTYTYPKQVFGKELYDQDPPLPKELLENCLKILKE